MVALIPRRRSELRILAVEYALSASTRSGLVRALAPLLRMILMSAINAVNAIESWRCGKGVREMCEQPL
jgi:hypothetical protein